MGTFGHSCSSPLIPKGYGLQVNIILKASTGSRMDVELDHFSDFSLDIRNRIATLGAFRSQKPALEKHLFPWCLQRRFPMNLNPVFIECCGADSAHDTCISSRV